MSKVIPWVAGVVFLVAIIVVLLTYSKVNKIQNYMLDERPSKPQKEENKNGSEE